MMLELKDISIGYRNRILLRNVSADLEEGRLAALLGCNGAGKSTLLRTLNGLQPLQGGQILISGKDICRMSREEMSRTVAFVGTEKVRIPDLECRELVGLGRAPYTDWIGRLSPEDRKAVDEALEAVGMTEYATRTLDKMSDGECQRIMIARALAQDTPVLLLDEPTAFLDLPGRYATVQLLHRLASEKGKTILFSTHDLDIAAEEADDILLMDPPHLLSGHSQEIMASGAVGKAFGLKKYSR